ncbi:Fe-S protein assembly co-chaperone HscB [Piscinibacter koreensis]|uniref:Co-chaperone protein HscB homolog n=1 Tax=Piscinibacter koreensis TaxID=2742824 RepID=A0A7Y6TYH1_9BURK|nr:Fe-S protein assembly co-chaperone HscB [Schlegelella koreensis]NUZ08120.1 Fe-S protein assembly co-chaperone HscB [Schlegelella koreensis]
MNLDSDDFELFGVPKRFAQDREVLDRRRRELQAQVHPDRFARAGAAGQRVATQWAVRVNEAYTRLSDPVRRASYLCELNGAPVDAERNTAMPPDFLVRQLEWREALDDADTREAIDAIAREVAAERADLLARIGAALDTAHDYPAASRSVRALMFVDRFADDVQRRADRIEA